jgi:hypothetical protein
MKQLIARLNEMKLVLKSKKLKKLMGLKVHHDGLKPNNFLERRSAVASLRKRLILTWWSN